MIDLWRQCPHAVISQRFIDLAAHRHNLHFQSSVVTVMQLDWSILIFGCSGLQLGSSDDTDQWHMCKTCGLFIWLDISIHKADDWTRLINGAGKSLAVDLHWWFLFLQDDLGSTRLLRVSFPRNRWQIWLKFLGHVAKRFNCKTVSRNFENFSSFLFYRQKR